MTQARAFRAFVLARHWALSLLAIAVMTVVVFAAANVVAYFTIRQFPAWTETAEARITREFNERFGAQQAPFVKRWLAIDNDVDLHAFFVENTAHSVTGNVYEDFTLFKTTPWSGRFFNFTSDGYRVVREQGPWPPSPRFYNIFFFGGSTTMGIGPDWATVPSYLQEHFKTADVGGKPARVYNFGRGAYFSTQERILLQQLLLKRFIPDMVIFLDGLNDFYYLDGRPSSYDSFERTFNKAMAASSGTRPPGRTMIDAVVDRLMLLPLVELASTIGDKMSEREAALPTYKSIQPPRHELHAVVDRYIEHIRQVEGISRAYGITPLFVWQPVPGYKYDLKYHIQLNPIYGLGGHERSAQGYPIAAERRAEFGQSFLWLGDIQEDRTEPLYMDAVHYNADFSKTIADKIGAAILQMEPRTPMPRDEPTSSPTDVTSRRLN